MERLRHNLTKDSEKKNREWNRIRQRPIGR